MPAKTNHHPRSLIVRPSPLDRRKAILSFGPLSIKAALGRSGITSLKREGDGGTPRGTLRILYAYRRGERNGHLPTPLPTRRIKADMLWCDASEHPAYNRPVKAPFVASHEKLLRQDRLYDVCVVLDWNIRQRRRGCGSAIFFHLAKPGYQPTEGCIAVSLRDMQRLLPHLRPGTKIRIP
ncbi:L,D-transpeptidase family protein [Rhizobium sp. RU36D]|uniref:L,D-transpeptidase family protein n=1 Tax=Rhizobium sp. RU36D TaxID=1907415 RepID=UPI0009D7F046|nr:L,D-transpeptidase family protein [Rhizobium sp. RU36D]SMC88699.1 L,D-peptidoglycan transpeptidase YkuD, ErfK/YbiS/YcfS/YnhG family [Rhizobium sp. RU36D]